MTMKKKLVLDAVMVVLLFVAIAYVATGNFLHECVGVLAVVLFVAHNVVNRWWHRAIFSGKYAPLRIVSLVANVALALAVVIVAVTGVMLSRDLFPFVPSGGGLTAREIHTTVANWLFVLVPVHIGLHAKMLLGFFRANRLSKPCSIAIVVAASVVGAWGIYSFVRRDFVGKLSAENSFDMFALSEPAWRFFLDYFCLAVALVLVGTILQKAALSLPKKRPQQ